MKCLVILSTVVVFVVAKPSTVVTPHVNAITYSSHLPTVFNTAYASASSIIHAAPVAVKTTPLLVAPISSQYHSQDALGQYSFGYSSPLSAQNEAKTIDGITRGGYTYVDANGKVQTVSYVSDALNGFRVAATNFPIAPAAVQDTPEVVAARTAHLAAREEVKMKTGSVEVTPTKVGHEKAQAPEVETRILTAHAAPSAYSAYSSYITHRPAFGIASPAFTSYTPIIADTVAVEAKIPGFAAYSARPLYKFNVFPSNPVTMNEVLTAKAAKVFQVKTEEKSKLKVKSD